MAGMSAQGRGRGRGREARRARDKMPSPSSSFPTPFQKMLSAITHKVHALLTALLIYVVALGPMPRHVGFVMDGNRRYARGKGRRVTQGYEEGFESLRRILDICLRLRIRAVTVYAFSIENFNRSKEEVDTLMRLAKEGFTSLCDQQEILHRHGVRIKFVGNFDMLPEDLKASARKMEAMTAHHTGGVLHVASPYTSRDEATSAIRDTVAHVHATERSADITSQDVWDNLQITRSIESLPDAGKGKVDILVRTSNVRRFSDFLMWQSNEDTQFHFVKSTWPEFGLTNMLPILLGWQQKVWLQRLSLWT